MVVRNDLFVPVCRLLLFQSSRVGWDPFSDLGD